jgi:hypothetical protein
MGSVPTRDLYHFSHNKLIERQGIFYWETWHGKQFINMREVKVTITKPETLSYGNPKVIIVDEEDPTSKGFTTVRDYRHYEIENQHFLVFRSVK